MMALICILQDLIFQKENEIINGHQILLLKISCDNRDYYYILDAKYSNEINVKKRYISELVLKYSTQIASKDKFFSDVIGVGAIYPGEKDKIYFFKKNDVDSNRISLPQYFSRAIVGENIGDIFLKERLEKLLKIIDVIECEREDVNAYLPVIQETRDILRTDEIEEFLGKTVEEGDIDYKKEKKSLSVHVTDRPQNHDTVVINGKKCFYYGKSLCLYKRTRCDVGEKSCEYYILKSSKKLLKEEDTCRNFIRYTKRGKVSRVECSVSGLPGCVGPENCKFCMKKNKSKR